MEETPAVITRTRATSRVITDRHVIAFALATSAIAHAAPPCGPAASVTGDPSVSHEIADTLRSRGIREPQPGCPAESARVERRGDGIEVWIVDPDGRTSERRVADLSTAAALIETFASQTALPGPAFAAAPRAQDPEQPRVLVRVHSAPPSVRGTIGIAAESSVANDGSIWAGARARACVKLGPTCVGGEARFASDVLVNGEAEQAEARRSAGDLQLIAEYPIVRDGWSVTPGVGVGVGWLRVRRDFMDSTGSDTVEIDAGGPRTSAHLTAAFPLGRSIVLTVGAAVDLLSLIHI